MIFSKYIIRKKSGRPFSTGEKLAFAIKTTHNQFDPKHRLAYVIDNDTVVNCDVCDIVLDISDTYYVYVEYEYVFEWFNPETNTWILAPTQTNYFQSLHCSNIAQDFLVHRRICNTLSKDCRLVSYKFKEI